MKLKLTPLPATVLGIYGPSKNELPERMRYLHPDAAASFLKLDSGPHRLRVSDMWRSAEASMRARTEKRGVQPPGRSGHNYGFCIDLDVDWMLKQYGWTKAQLDSFMNDAGWFCHRKDHERDSESWHFNYFGAQADRYLAQSAGKSSTASGLELKIQDLYGESFKLSSAEAQTALAALKLYGGAIDGELGGLSAEALKAFKRTWELPAGTELDPETQRLLAFTTSARELV